MRRKKSNVQDLAGALLLSVLAFDHAGSQTKARARDLGIALDGTPGRFNAITDVQGVEVGYATLIEGEGRRTVGKGPVRTGVTAILPRGRGSSIRSSPRSTQATAMFSRLPS